MSQQIIEAGILGGIGIMLFSLAGAIYYTWFSSRPKWLGRTLTIMSLGGTAMMICCSIIYKLMHYGPV